MTLAGEFAPHARLSSKSRIVVVGTSGAGKTNLASRLSALLGIKDIELDALYWGPNWTGVDPNTFRERVKSATASSEGWVVHGNYSRTQDLTWRRATAVIWLDYPRPLVFWRVLKRSIVRIVRGEELWSGNKESIRKTFLSRDSILLWSWRTFERRKQQYEAAFRAPENSHLELLRFTHPRELERFLSAL